jgi:PAS domain S-box-containing protein
LSIRLYLALLTIAVALPLVGLALMMAGQIATGERQATKSSLLSNAWSLADSVNREIEKHIAVAATLSSSPELLSGDFSAFYARAKQALEYLPDSWILVVDPDGQQLLNTLRPFGEPLPKRPLREVEERAKETAKAEVSDVFDGLVAQRLIALAVVPVFQGGKFRYFVDVGLTPEHFGKVLGDQNYPSEWFAGIIDGNGRVLASQRDPEGRRVGMLVSQSWSDSIAQSPAGTTENTSIEGTVLIGGYAPTAYGWTVGVAIDKVSLDAPVARTRSVLLVSATASVAVSLLLAWLIARKFDASADSLQAAAVAMGQEKRVALKPSGIREFDELMQAFASASSRLRARSEERERAEHVAEQLAAIVQCSDDAIISKDLNGTIRTWNPGAERLFGYSSVEVVGKHITILFPPDREHEETEILQRLRRGEHIDHYETIRRRKDGTLLDISLTVSPIRNAKGQIIAASKIARDITERKRAEQSQKTLTRELQHRTINLLAVVQSIAQRSLAGTTSVDEAQKAFQARLQALARAHRQLTQSNWAGVPLAEVVRAQLEVFGANTSMEGPPVILTAQQAQNFALAIHELATNAVKHGALSTPRGAVRISWSVVHNGGNNVLRFCWSERGGPPVRQPVRRGFGSSLLQAIFGTSCFEFSAEGLCCTAEIALAEKQVGEVTSPVMV